MNARPHQWSLKRRLATRLLVVLTLAVLVPPAIVIVAALWTINTMHDRALQDQAADIVRALDVSVEPPVLRLPDELASAYVLSHDAYLYLVLDRDGRTVLSSSPHASAVAGRAIVEAPSTFFLVPRPGGRPWYVYSTAAGAYRVVVAQDSLHEDVLSDSITRELANISLLTALPVLAMALLVVMWTLNRAFRDVTRVADDARAITPDSVEAQLSGEGLPREILPLVDAVNVALARLTRAYHVEQRFTTDAAHELRTPVAVLMARIDTLAPGPMKDSLAQDAARLSRLVSQMLQVARLDTRPMVMDQSVDLAVVVRDAVALLGPLALRDKRRMEMTAPNRPVVVRGHGYALGVAVTNLVENALLHTPVGTPIDIQVTPEPAIRVLDRGSGVPPEERTLIFERFQRSPTTTSSGTGLGLAIVAEIAARHHASVAVEPREGGGSVFTIRWMKAA